MAPTKRPAASSMGGAKKRKVDVVGPKVAAVSQALLEHGVLAGSTSAMLSSMGTFCLGVPKDERHAYQAEITGMIGEALTAAEAELVKSVADCKTKVDNTAADKVSRSAAVTAAASALESLQAATAEKVQAVGEAEKAQKAAMAAGDEARSKESKGAAVAKKQEAKKASLEQAMKGYLAPLKERAVASKEDKAALKKLVAIGKEFEFDASMLETLPKAVKKEPVERGTFDTLTLSKLEEEILAAVAKLDKALADGKPEQAELEAAVKGVEAAEEAAATALTAASDALAGAKAAEKAGKTALKEAESAAKAWLKDTKDVMDTFDSLTATLDEFRSGPLTFYGDLKDLTPPPPEPEAPAEPEVLAEAPAEVPADGQP